jgi:hypothetical protein
VTLSLGSSFIIAIAATAVLAIFLAIVVISSVISDRPSRPRHPEPPHSKTAVSGTRHEEDPRSMAPRQDQAARPAPGAGPPPRDRLS